MPHPRASNADPAHQDGAASGLSPVPAAGTAVTHSGFLGVSRVRAYLGSRPTLTPADLSLFCQRVYSSRSMVRVTRPGTTLLP